MNTPLRKRFAFQTNRSLPEMVDLSNDGLFFWWIFYAVYINCPFVCNVKENILRIDSFSASLFVTKNKIDPMMQVSADMIAFQCLSVSSDESFRPLAQGGKSTSSTTSPFCVLPKSNKLELTKNSGKKKNSGISSLTSCILSRDALLQLPEMLLKSLSGKSKWPSCSVIAKREKGSRRNNNTKHNLL